MQRSIKDLRYVITLQNVGTAVANDVTLTNNIPLGTTYVNNSMHVSSGFGQYLAAENRIFWLGDLAPGQAATITFDVYVQAGVAAGSTIRNTAYAGGEQATATTLIKVVQEPAWVLLVYLSADNNNALLGYTPYLPTGIAWDDNSGDHLSTKELGEALYWATDEQVNPFDVLFFDASMMAIFMPRCGILLSESSALPT